MATVVVDQNAVRLANTHNALTRTRPLGGAASVGDAVKYDSNGNWVIQAGGGIVMGVIIGIKNSGMPLDDGTAGDDAEVLLGGIVAGYTVTPGLIVYDGGDGTLVDTGTVAQIIGVGLDSSLLLVQPNHHVDLLV